MTDRSITKKHLYFIFHHSYFEGETHGFTLIELLVVVAIIAILAGMLLPALNSARDTALTIKCTGNFKTLVTGMFAYHDAYERYVPSTFLESGSGYSCWVSNKTFQKLAGMTGSHDVYSYAWSSKYACPGIPLKQTWANTPDKFTGDRYYSMMTKQLNPDATIKTGLKSNQIKTPSMKYFIYEGLGGGSLTGTSSTPRSNYILYGEDYTKKGQYSYYWTYRHKGRTVCNASYYDGHVGSAQESEIYDPDGNRNKRLYFDAR